MIRTTAFLLAMLLPCVAAAQSTTSCNTFGGTTTCSHSPSYPAALYVPQPSASDCEAGVGVKPFAFTPAQKRCKNLYQRRQAIGPLIAAGRCDEARDVALQSGDLNLAQQVQSLCKPAPAQ